MRPCNDCERFTPNQAFDPARDCRLCWLNFHDESYRNHWAGKKTPKTPKQSQPKPDSGPGTELKKILNELDIVSFEGCDCDGKAAQMDRWGVEGCQENFETIRGWIAAAQAKAGWLTTIAAATRAATTGIALHLDPLDIPRSLARLSIERARKNERRNPRRAD